MAASNQVHPQPSSALPKGVSAEQVRAQLGRVLDSQTFVHSDRMTRFLRFVVEQSLAGEAHRLNEYLLGVEVFDRSESFDPRIDAIVRVDARRLRSKLSEYYASRGAGDPIRIEVPKGSYAPAFRDAGLPEADRRDAMPTIAVIPFTNLNHDKQGEFLSDGITEDLIDGLAKVNGLWVVSRTSVFQFKGAAADVRDLGRDLGVAFLLEGTVRRVGNRLRVTAQLVSAENGYHLWSERYDRTLDDIFAIQDEIARTIVAKLRVQFKVEAKGPLVAAATGNLTAYNLCKKGRHFLQKWSPKNLEKAIRYLTEALDEDPNYAAAHAGLADAYATLGYWSLAAPQEIMPRAREEAQKALAIDSTLADAHISLGTVNALYDWDFLGAEQEYRRSMELNSRNALGHYALADFCLLPTGRLDEALVEAKKAQEMAPLSPLIGTGLAWSYFAMERFDQAIEESQRALDLDAGALEPFWPLALSLECQSRYEDALRVLARVDRLHPNNPMTLALLARCQALAGQRERAETTLQKIIRLSGRRYVAPSHLALVFLGMGDVGRAIEQYELAYENRDTTVICPKHIVLTSGVTGKRLLEIRDKIGLKVSTSDRP